MLAVVVFVAHNLANIFPIDNARRIAQQPNQRLPSSVSSCHQMLASNIFQYQLSAVPSCHIMLGSNLFQLPASSPFVD